MAGDWPIHQGYATYRITPHNSTSQTIDVDALTQSIANTANQALTKAATFQEQQTQLEENLQTLALRTEREKQFSDDLVHVMADANLSR